MRPKRFGQKKKQVRGATVKASGASESSAQNSSVIPVADASESSVEQCSVALVVSNEICTLTH